MNVMNKQVIADNQCAKVGCFANPFIVYQEWNNNKFPMFCAPLSFNPNGPENILTDLNLKAQVC